MRQDHLCPVAHASALPYSGGGQAAYSSSSSSPTAAPSTGASYGSPSKIDGRHHDFLDGRLPTRRLSHLVAHVLDALGGLEQRIEVCLRLGLVKAPRLIEAPLSLYWLADFAMPPGPGRTRPWTLARTADSSRQGPGRLRRLLGVADLLGAELVAFGIGQNPPAVMLRDRGTGDTFLHQPKCGPCDAPVAGLSVSTVEVAQDGQHTAVVVVVGGEAELGEDVGDVLLDGAFGDDEGSG